MTSVNRRILSFLPYLSPLQQDVVDLGVATGRGKDVDGRSIAASTEVPQHHGLPACPNTCCGVHLCRGEAVWWQAGGNAFHIKEFTIVKTT